MHRYIRAIGFSRLENRSKQNKLIAAAFNDSTNKNEVPIDQDTNLVQVNRSFGEGIGISIVGEYDKDGIFSLDHFFPYCSGTVILEQSDLQIERYNDKEGYCGISDDYNLGMTLVYTLQNITDYIKHSFTNQSLPENVILGGLSLEGSILCGVHLDYIANPYDKQPISSKDRRNLIAKAKSGDMSALEDLTIDDMDTYSFVSKRIKDEDLFTVIETYFMPYGINNELYSVLGVITNITKITNEFSDELVYNLTVLCNDVTLNVAINSLDILGEPQIGRRFKGIVWLQGYINFNHS